MLLGARTGLFGGGNGGEEPYDYLVEYIENANPNVNNGFTIPAFRGFVGQATNSITADIEIEFELLESMTTTQPAYTCCFGYSTTVRGGFYALSNSVSKASFCVGSITSRVRVTEELEKMTTARMQIEQGTAKLYSNGEYIDTATNTTTTEIYTENFGVFGAVRNISTGEFFGSNEKWRIRSLKCKTPYIEIELVACVKNGKPCFYDRVNKEFYGLDLADGDLVAGPKVEPLPYDAELEYIYHDGKCESSIKTGVYTEEGMRVRVKYFSYGGSILAPVIATTDAEESNRGLILYAHNLCYMEGIRFDGRDSLNLYGNPMWHDVVIGGGACVADGEEIEGSEAYWSPSYGSEIHMFAFGGGRVSTNEFIAVKSFEVWNSAGELQHEFIPVRIGASPYLYDKVTRDLVGSHDGDGLLCGPDKGCKPYDYLCDYIAGDGAAMVKTYVRFGNELRNALDFYMKINIRGSDEVPSQDQILMRFGSTTAYAAGVTMSPTVWKAYKLTAMGSVTLPISVTDPIEIEYDASGGAVNISANGSSVFTGSITSTTQLNAGIMPILFADCYGGTSQLYINVKAVEKPIRVRSFYIKNRRSGAEVDLKACVKDGVGYFYDEGSGMLFGNSADAGALLFGDRIEE